MKSQPCALLVNNDTINAMYLKMILERNGWLTKKVSCKNAVIEQAMSGKYQIVILAGNPVFDYSLELIRSIRALESVCRIPILYLCTSLSERGKMLLHEHKVYTYLSAPIDADAVMHLLSNMQQNEMESLSVRGTES